MSVLNRARRGELGPAMKAYQDGFGDGIAEMLDQLEGRSQIAPDGCYRGPMPDELLTWLADVRKRLDAERRRA